MPPRGNLNPDKKKKKGRGGRTGRTPTEIGQTTPSTSKGQAQKSAALSQASSGRPVSNVYTPSAEPAPTTSGPAPSRMPSTIAPTDTDYAGPRLSESTTLTPKEARKNYEESVAKKAAEQAKNYQETETAKILDKFVKKDENGEPVFNEKEVPAIKTSAEKAEEGVAKFEKAIAKIARKSSTRSEAIKKIDRARKRLVGRHVELTKDGGIKMEKIKIPVFREGEFTVGSITEAWQRGETEDLRELSAERVARRRLKNVEREAKKIKRTWKPGDPRHLPVQKALRKEAKDKAREEAESGVSGVIRDVTGALGDVFRGQEESLGVGTAGLGGSVDLDDIKIPEPVITGVNHLIDWITRPGVFTETAIAKALAGEDIGPIDLPDLIGGKIGEKIREAPGPGEAFMRGHTDPKVISGGDIAEGLFGLREAGILVDIATDPLFYVGVGGLARGGRAANEAMERLARIKRYSPKSLNSARFKRLTLEADRTGDMSDLSSYLKKVEANNLTRFQRRRPGRRRAGRKEKKEQQLRINEALLDSARKKLANASSYGGSKLVLPGDLISDAVSLVGRHAIGTRSLEPGFRLRALTPFGRELGSVPVPIPGVLADIKAFPAFRTRTRKLLKTSREERALSEGMEGLHRSRVQILDDIKQAERAGDNTRVIALRAKLAENDAAEHQLRNEARSGAEVTKRTGGHRWHSLREAIEQKNRSRLTHEAFRISAHQARQFDQDVQGKLATIVKPIRDDPESLAAVTLARLAKQDTGSGTFFTRNVRKLTDKEAKVMKDLERLDKQIGVHGKELGTINSMIDHYVTRLWQEKGDPFATIRPGEPLEDFPNMGRSGGSTPYFARHRVQPEMASIADPNLLAQAIARISKGQLDDAAARAVADQWHRLGLVRGQIERMGRFLQRGGRLNVDELTDSQARALRWSEHMAANDKDVPRIFRMTDEGDLRLADDSRSPFEAQVEGVDAELKKLYSAVTDRAEVEDLLKNVTGGLRKEYQLQAARLEDEISELLPALDLAPTTKWTKIKAGRYATEDQRFVILKNKDGWNLVNRETKEVLATRRTLQEAKDALPAPEPELLSAVRGRYKELSGRGVDNPDSWDIKGLKPHYNREGGDPFDYTGRLEDRRAGILKKSEANLFPVLDPRTSTFWRTRTEGVHSAFRSRWKGLDQVVGKSRTDVEGAIAYTKSGKQIPERDLKKIQDDRGNITGYQHRETGTKYTLDEITIPELGMVPNADNTLWYHPASGEEFARPADLDPNGMGWSIQQIIGEDKLWPTAVFADAQAEALRLGENVSKQIYDVGMEKMFQRAMGLFRYGVTTPFPAYHVRNLVSDAFKSLQADSGVVFHPLMNARLTALMWRRGKFGKRKIPGLGTIRYGKDGIKVPGFKKALKVEELTFIAELFGIRSTQHLAEFLRIANTGRVPSKTRRRFSLGPEGKPGQLAIEYGARREDIMRMITFMQRMRRNNGDVADAAWYMTKHHFDYADLTAFERRVMRNAFLFYTWYRKNIPLQFMEIISRPGFFSGVANGYYALSRGETPLNVDWSQIHPILPDMSGPIPKRGLVPDYMLGQLGAATMNWNDHTAAFAIGAPWVDMNIVSNLLVDPVQSGRQFITLLNPAANLLYQMVFPNDLLTGREFKTFESTAPMFAALAELLGAPVHETDRGPAIPMRLALIFRNIPIAGRGSSYFREPGSGRDTGRLTKYKNWLSFLTGLNTFVSPPATKEKRAQVAWIESRAGERTSTSQSLSNIPDSEADKILHEFDRETLAEAKRRGIPLEILREVEGSGPWYEGKPDDRSIPEPEYGLGGDLDFSPDRSGAGKLPNAKYGLDDSFSLDSITEFGGASGFGEPPSKKEPKDPYDIRIDRKGRVFMENPEVKGDREEGVARRLRTAVAKSGGTVDGPLTESQRTFARTLSKETGLSPRVVAAWQLAEESGANAASKEQEGYHNWLNIGPFLQSPRFNDPESGAKATADFLKGKIWGPGANIPSIITSAGKSDEEQMRTIEQSGFSATGYGAGASLDSTYGLVSAKSKPVPKKLKKEAKDVLGSEKTKRILTNAGKPAEPKKREGPWEGSQRAVLSQIPKRARVQGRGDKRTPAENTSVGGSPTSHHLTTNPASYAADIEPDLDVYHEIQDELGLPRSDSGNQSIVKDGYEYQLIFGAEHNHADHIHLGAQYTGAAASAPSGVTAGGTPTGTAASSGTATPPASPMVPAPAPGGYGFGQDEEESTYDPYELVELAKPLEERLRPYQLAQNINVAAPGVPSVNIRVPESIAEDLAEEIRRRMGA